MRFYLSVFFLAAVTGASATDIGMSKVDPRFTLDSNSTPIIVGNMPKLRFQRAIGLCTDVVTATLIDHANCAATKTADCAAVPDDKKVSPLDISRFNKAPGDDQDFESRKAYPELQEAGGTADVLNRAAIVVGASVKESCAPYDQFFGGLENPDDMSRSIWLRFEPEYKKGKSQVNCPSCVAKAAKKMKRKYGLAPSEEQIQAAFSEESYGRFLSKILIPVECTKMKAMVYLEANYEIGYFPTTEEFGKSEDRQSLYEQAMDKVKDLLSRQIPLSLDYCAEPTGNSLENCKMAHAVVVRGYKRICSEGSDCRDALQIQNSLGQKWQDDFDDGWVDAKTLLDKTFYDKASMSWLEPAEHKLPVIE